MSKKFQKRKEDFTCEKCGFLVSGNGFTNHCPKCLWGKHVDINPGDRAESCGGMMEPIRVEKKDSRYFVIHKCVKCQKEKPNVVTSEDDFDVVTKVSEIYANKQVGK